MSLAKENFYKNLILAFILISVLPLIILLFDNSVIDGFWYRFGNVSGYIGGVLMLWQFFLGIRGVVRNITSDYDWSVKLHTFLGINSAIFVLLHPLLEAISYGKGLRFLLYPTFDSQSEIQYSYGKIALILFLLVWFSSSLLRKALQYRIWLYIHYYTYPMMFFVFIHPYFIGTFLNTYGAIKFYWIFLSVLGIVFVLIKLKDILNIGSEKYHLKDFKEYPGGNFTYSFIPTKHKFIPIPGQYFYIKKNSFGEAHPFSVFAYDDSTGEIVFGIKSLGKFTKDLSTLKIGDEVYIDGPYGQFTIEGQNSDPKVILAGGIGITPFFELVSRFSNEQTYMFYSNQKLDFALLRNEFKKYLGKRYFDCITDEKVEEDNVICDMLTGKNIQKNLPPDILKTARFFICGSPGFMVGMEKNLLTIGVKKSQIYIEEFGY
jgi:predicted ferric reductase